MASRQWTRRGVAVAAASWAAVGATGLLGGCGGGADKTKAQLRLVNASAYSALDMSIDDARRFASVAYGQTGAYLEADPAADKMDSVITRAGAASALVSLTPSVARDKFYTVLAWGREGELKALVLDDNTAAPASGKALVRVVNAAPDAGTVDLYLTGSDELLTDAVALQAGAAVGTAGAYLSVNSATWRLRATAAGDKGDLRLDVPTLALASGGLYTLVVTPGRGGVLVNALLLADRGSAIVRADATHTRVRVAAAVADGGSVNATVGGVGVIRNAGAPAVGAYALVGAGTPSLAVTVNGAAVSASAATLAAGADYTLLVYGPAAAPLLAWVEDDNRRPTEGDARVRLVNGVAGLGAGLSLAVDFAPLADDVAAGVASAYRTLDATTTARVAVTAPGSVAALFSAVDQTFAAGSNYTVFLTGSAIAPAGVVRRDR